jgi:hypothetical protein
VYRAPVATWGPVDRALRDAALVVGYPWNPDLNAPKGEDVSCYPVNNRDGRRISANEAFLEPARGRANLTIMGGALVDRMLLRDGRATGVRVRLAGQGWTDVNARQILICAGAIHSPAILMRSGIGSAATLTSLGITPVHNLPEVGRNFMDHPVLRATVRLRPEHVCLDPAQRHTNCCVTYTSGLGGGGTRDMILIGFNHRLLGEAGRPAPLASMGIYALLPWVALFVMLFVIGALSDRILHATGSVWAARVPVAIVGFRRAGIDRGVTHATGLADDDAAVHVARCGRADPGIDLVGNPGSGAVVDRRGLRLDKFLGQFGGRHGSGADRVPCALTGSWAGALLGIALSGLAGAVLWLFVHPERPVAALARLTPATV